MDFIRIPNRYFSPDPLAVWGTDEEKIDVNQGIYMIFSGICFRNGKAVRNKKVKSSLMQVYSVQFPERSQEDLDNIYGTIILADYKIFDRSSPDDIDRKGYARLTGPSVPIDVEDCDIRFFPRLYRKHETDDFYHPSKGLVFDQWWNMETRVEEVPTLDDPGYSGKCLSLDWGMAYKFGKLLYEYVETRCGTVKINYAIFRDAADSFLTVRLLEWHGEGDAANVYGTIHTYDTLVCDDEAKSVAFSLNRDNHMSVKPGQYIPLHRPGTVVPMRHKLKVEVAIFHKDNMGYDKVVAKGTHSFEARKLPKDEWVDEDEDESVGSEEEEYVGGNEEEDGDESVGGNEEEDGDFEDESTESGQSSNEDDQSKYKYEHLERSIDETHIICGEWGVIELTAYWMPSWCSQYLSELDDVSTKTLYAPRP